VALQHFAGDLGIAGLIGPDETDHLQSREKQESAEGDERQHVSGPPGTVL